MDKNLMFLKSSSFVLLVNLIVSSANAGISPLTPEVVGHVPVISELSISPSLPTVYSKVRANWRYFDRNGDLEAPPKIEWILSGKVMTEVNDSIYYDLPIDSEGKRLEVRVTPRSLAPSDPDQGHPVTSADVTIGPRSGSTPSVFGFIHPDNVDRSQEQATSYCASLSPAARLPTRRELQDVFLHFTSAEGLGSSHANRDMCNIHNWPMGWPAACGGHTSFYWTSERHQAVETLGYIVSMETGVADEFAVGNQYATACIR